VTTDVNEFARWSDPKGRMTRIEQEMARILVHLDPTHPRSGTNDTPRRVAKMYVEELCSGYQVKVNDLFTTFPAENSGMVIIKSIPMVSLCEHHLVPFMGHVHVGYIPSDEVVGLSKIKRVVDAFARRLQIQERLTGQIADAIDYNLHPRGVMVVIEAEHLCMTIRGVQSPGTKTVTSEVRGVFNANEEGEKEEFLRLLKNGA
jgi:GTP cyclohydrolase I